MDEQKPVTSDTPDSGLQPGGGQNGQAMDITVPQTIEPTVATPAAASTDTAINSEAPQTIEPTQTISSSEPVSTPQTPPDSPSFTEPSANPVSSEATSAESPTAGPSTGTTTEPIHEPPATNPTEVKPETPKPAHAPHSGMPVAAIVIAVVVAVALAGVVIYSYMQGRNSDAVKRSESSSQAVAEKPQASVADVDTTSEEIDNSLGQADDDKDFASSELSDATLGL